jgi:hypothetical protein
MFFVSDYFIDTYSGGAELTSEAIIQTSYANIEKIQSVNITEDFLVANKEEYWIFGNFATVPPAILLYVAKHLNYSVLEYDYKYCKYRSPEKHVVATKEECNCHEVHNGKLVSLFFAKAKSLWFMSEKQKEHYEKVFPFLEDQNSFVLSSVFSVETLKCLKALNTEKNNKWLVVNSGSWVKGTQAAIEYASHHNLEYFLAENLSYPDMLNALANCLGLIFLPLGKDTCPRLVIEAKLLDCKLIINDNVQHATEGWFANKNSIYTYLEQRPDIFWTEIRKTATNV